MKSFLKLASMMIIAGGVAVSAEGMNNNRRSKVTPIHDTWEEHEDIPRTIL